MLSKQQHIASKVSQAATISQIYGAVALPLERVLIKGVANVADFS
jgi:hypothetical protein